MESTVPSSRLAPAAAGALARQLADEVPWKARANLAEAQQLARAATRLAARSGDEGTKARALRAAGHVLALGTSYRAALERYNRASAIFERLGDDLQRAITISGALQTLIYLGQYSQAHAQARLARAIFTRHHDRARLARLESNVGNICFREDRFEAALRCYERAASDLGRLGEHRDAAIALRNMAVCLTSLNRFDDALTAYADARTYCARHDMPLQVAEVDYNVAYLHFLRGDYERAMALYAEASVHCDKVGERYHRALCDLDRAEVCLELNDLPRARALAQDAAASFERLGTRYERAKALTFLATATGRLGDTTSALRLFSDARALFAAEGNRSWPSAISLARALALYEADRIEEASALVKIAGPTSHAVPPSSRDVLWKILRARLSLRDEQPGRAARAALAARRALERVEAPALEWQVLLVTGECQEALGDRWLAYRSYRAAARSLDRLRVPLTTNELKISFLADKVAVYENLVRLTLTEEPASTREALAFGRIEESKSRSLADLLAFRAGEFRPRQPAAESAAASARQLQQELQWFTRRMAREEVNPTVSERQVRRLRAGARRRERALSGRLDELRQADADLASLQAGGSGDVNAIRAVLPEGVVIVEYYVARGIVYACVVERDHLRIAPLRPMMDVTRALRLLRLQLTKFQLGPDYVHTFSSMLMTATIRHLRDLYVMLLAPVARWLDARHLVVVPHGQLHYLPFHCLFDGREHLCDRYSISYAPSATVFAACQSRPDPPGRSGLVLAVDDAYAPHIAREAREVGATLPEARVFTGAAATSARLRTEGAEARYIHIATHGFFRRDNPMLSAIRLADGDLTLADLYGFRLASDLVSLSGCGTGLSAVVGGDELVGLARGLLYTGARSLLLTMWQVDDFSTAEFMASFYRHVIAGTEKAAAVRLAMQEVRERFPHPYHWAPFALVGHLGGSGGERPHRGQSPRETAPRR